MKKLKEMISINEGDDSLEKYWQDILDLSIIRKAKIKVGKTGFIPDVEYHSGSVGWVGDGFLIYATPAWDGQKYIPFEDGHTGKVLGKVPLKTTGVDRKDSKWYLDTIKRSLPKFIKKATQEN